MIPMEKPLSEILNSIPPKPPRSKLEPYYELIRELRRQSRTYREIATILKDHLGVRVDHSTICDFVHLRARRARTPRRREELPPSAPDNGASLCDSDGDSPVPSRRSRAVDGTSDVYARIETMKWRKGSPRAADPGFHYEEGAPLRLISDPSKK
jgi:hypothetical protein